ncbi:DUF2155 domain-containing protein [Xanthobacter sp. TB0139]|uniref:DUF2155 domain-containing protein n=1 Tax=Xanthobacter sp. TB0139 TaxID=3459178 RepID=UPI00403A0641
MRLTPIAPLLALALLGGSGFGVLALAQGREGIEQSFLPPPSSFGASTNQTPYGGAADQRFRTGQGFDARPGQEGVVVAPQDGGAFAPAGSTIVVPNETGDVTVVQPPSVKVPNRIAVFAGLDKITGRITSFDVPIGETAQFGALQVTPRVCYTRPPTETQNITSFSEVNEVTLKGEAKRIFTGWMFASSPGLHAVEHPIYDVWLIGCKAPAPVMAGPAGGQQ